MRKYGIYIIFIYIKPRMYLLVNMKYAKYNEKISIQ
jgi:hypothetical protein